MKSYVYHITSSSVNDIDDFVTAYTPFEAVNKYIDWYKKNQKIDILSSDILTIERIGNNLE